MRCIKHTLLLLSIILVVSGCAQSVLRSTTKDENISKQDHNFALQPGDLLFQDLDSGPLCDAIEKVTTGFGGANFSHVGIVAKDDSDSFVVIEAVRNGVEVTPLQTFLERSADAKAQFAINNGSYYCSELVYEIFLRANDNNPVFTLQPMTFKDPNTKETLAAWEEYFSKLGVLIPEGQPGINPGGISRSPVLAIVHKYGTPDKRPLLQGK